MDIQIVIRDTDLATLDELAERDWRHREQQASALLEQVLRVERARADPNRRTRPVQRRAPRALSNGVARVEA